jgi:Cu+-exporting ATPase
MVGTGKGAENGVLYRSAEALERLGSVKAIVLDKTGTLTEGKPRVTDFVLAPDRTDEAEVLSLIAAAELASEHPLAAAIVHYARDERGLTLPDATEFEATAGQGISAKVNGRRVEVGRSELVGTAAKFAAEGKTPVFATIDGHAAAVIAIADTLKPSAAAAVKERRRRVIEITMLTGDNELTAHAIARQAGIERVLADVRPDEKQAQIRRLQSQKKKVAMVGDGINDAPALAQADVGIAIGTGTDVAIESAQVTLMSGDLGGLVTAIDLSRATMRNIRQNLFWAFAYNVALIPLAAGALYPFTGVLLDPIIAAAAMAASSVTVVSNALRLRGWRPARPPRVSGSARKVAAAA